MSTPDHTPTSGKRDYICDRCGTVFQSYPSQQQGEHVYCSRACSNADKIGRKTQAHKPLAVADDVLIAEYQAGATLKQLAERYGLTFAGIAYRLKINGVKRRQRWDGYHSHEMEVLRQQVGETTDFPRQRGVSGIYAILCDGSDTVYVGSAIDLRKRKTTHVRDLRDGKHINPHLQHSWDKYGEVAFRFRVLELCAPDVLLEREQHYIDTLKPQLNIAISSTAPFTGKTHTEEARQAMSNKLTGRTLSAEHRANIGKARKGQGKPDEERKRIAQSLTGRLLVLSEDDIPRIQQLRQQGMSLRQIAALYNVSTGTVRRALNR